MSEPLLCSYRALVVDDEPAIRQLVLRALARQGFKCDTACHGLEAKCLIATTAYDVVITDLSMPVENGFSLATELTSRADRPLLIVLTGVVEPRIVRELIRRGVDDVLFKPTDLEVFAAKVSALVERRTLIVKGNDRPAERREQGTDNQVETTVEGNCEIPQSNGDGRSEPTVASAESIAEACRSAHRPRMAKSERQQAAGNSTATYAAGVSGGLQPPATNAAENSIGAARPSGNEVAKQLADRVRLGAIRARQWPTSGARNRYSPPLVKESTASVGPCLPAAPVFAPSDNVWSLAVRTAGCIAVAISILFGALALSVVLSAPPHPMDSRVSPGEQQAIAAIGKLGGSVTIRADGFDVVLTPENLPTALRYLRRLSDVRSLDLSATGAGDEDLYAIHTLVTLSELNLATTTITDSTLRRISALPGLEALNLAGTDVSDAGLEFLKPLKHLRTLDLTATRVSRAAIIDLKRALPAAAIIGGI